MKIITAKTYMQKLTGLMGKKNINYGMFFPGVSSIHTFFMKENIDVIMCDEDNKILFYYKDLPRGKIILPKCGVKRVFETPSGYFDIEVGKRMIINEN